VAVEGGEEGVWVGWLVNGKRGRNARETERKMDVLVGGAVGRHCISSSECYCGQVWLKPRLRGSLASQVSLMMMFDLVAQEGIGWG
jgi:hypothetical protein